MSGKKANVSVQREWDRRVLCYSGDGQPLVLPRASADWTRPTHIRESNLLYSVYWFKCLFHWLHFHFSLSCIGEGNGNPLQCSCLENPRDGGAWWAAVYGVAQSRTWLKQLSSSSSFEKHSYKYIQVIVGRNIWIPCGQSSYHITLTLRHILRILNGEYWVFLWFLVV